MFHHPPRAAGHHLLRWSPFGRPTPFGRRTTLLLGGALAAGLLSPVSAEPQLQGYGQTLGTSPQERQVFDPGSKDSSILDSTNPLDLMNKLRRSTALDDATSPGSAIDQALKEYEAKATPAPLTSGKVLKAP